MLPPPNPEEGKWLFIPNQPVIRYPLNTMDVPMANRIEDVSADSPSQSMVHLINRANPPTPLTNQWPDAFQPQQSAEVIIPRQHFNDLVGLKPTIDNIQQTLESLGGQLNPNDPNPIDPSQPAIGNAIKQLTQYCLNLGELFNKVADTVTSNTQGLTNELLIRDNRSQDMIKQHHQEMARKQDELIQQKQTISKIIDTINKVAKNTALLPDSKEKITDIHTLGHEVKRKLEAAQINYDDQMTLLKQDLQSIKTNISDHPDADAIARSVRDITDGRYQTIKDAISEKHSALLVHNQKMNDLKEAIRSHSAQYQSLRANYADLQLLVIREAKEAANSNTPRAEAKWLEFKNHAAARESQIKDEIMEYTKDFGNQMTKTIMENFKLNNKEANSITKAALERIREDIAADLDNDAKTLKEALHLQEKQMNAMNSLHESFAATLRIEADSRAQNDAKTIKKEAHSTSQVPQQSKVPDQTSSSVNAQEPPQVTHSQLIPPSISTPLFINNPTSTTNPPTPPLQPFINISNTGTNSPPPPPPHLKPSLDSHVTYSRCTEVFYTEVFALTKY
ncbi:hypothetical protein HYPBUDRAFT_169008 [Hyphopichia burtonii NRRL Y-1933]|uniref:Uncharacterized protein n=1 Tax=Hyphopichia burtonii NRRL Y-1933 TaxID=984485 RepID=A0A1E4RBG7_9ASCO|nr:hypothetical protein HYPBUDRAFT_169008 [Hyphopichia burtonii NRRL Y-1933]ODV64612.1 hypothetical protein HYPBUDRAFT_169008 [Hyphopichia burtonii NRRL Y-1933]